VAGRGVVDTEDVVQELPDIAVRAVPWLAPTDIEQNNSRLTPRRQRRLRGERKPVVSIKVQSAHHWLKGSREAVGVERGIARICLKQVEPALQTGPSALKRPDLGVQLWRADYLPARRVRRQGRLNQSSGPKPAGMLTGLRSPSERERSASPYSASKSRW
jgi:hypothetical protein